MYEENKRFSWTNLFIKIIIVVIFILFTVWLLSLSNRDMSNSLDVLTDNIFSQNIEKMKEVGKEYFTTERLPEKVGEVKTLTLSKMYDKKLILELKDKNGKACSGPNSYVSIEKMENEYQMKVYLECGEESDYVVVIMGCYSYCDSDICEKQETRETKELEYEYKKTTGGYWTNWGNWSDWSNVSVSKTDYRDVETKVVKEEYTYDKPVTESKYAGEVSCETISGYTLDYIDKGVCHYSKASYSYDDPTCPEVAGYYLDNRDGFTCNYKKWIQDTQTPKCPEVAGYKLANQDGFTCNYIKSSSSDTKDPVCSTVSGYTYTGRDGFTCNYSKTSSDTKDPVCPTVSGYTYTGRNGFTCNYSRQVKSSDYTLEYYKSGSGSYVPKDTDTYHYEQTSADYVYKCDGSCSFQWVYTYNIYKKVYKTTTELTTRTATCDTANGYSKSGNSCVKSNTEKTTKTAECPTGYSKSENTCAKNIETTRKATCPTEYKEVGNTCMVYYQLSTTKTATCDSSKGYYKSGRTCAKTNYYWTETRNAYCPTGQTMKDYKCYKDVTTNVSTKGTKDVTYYRYRLRDYVGGTSDYKWSSSNNDSSLISAGYTLTGKTREKEVGGNK